MNDRTLKGLTGSMIFLCASAAHAQAPAAGDAPKPAADAPAAAPAAPEAPKPDAAKPAAAPKPPVTSKFGAEFTGVAELDMIVDSTQSFNDVPGNAAIVHDPLPVAGVQTKTYAANHSRTHFSARNSKIGFKIKGPESEDFKTSALVEMDFFGRQDAGASEQQVWSAGPMRIRHAHMKLETPVVDVLAGQAWQLFGYLPIFIPNTVSIHGVPGEVFGRAPQLRVSHNFKSDAFNVEPALALARPPQRDSGLPDFQGGIRFTLNGQKGIHTAGQAGTAVNPLSIGVSGVARSFKAPKLNQAGPDLTPTETAMGKGVSIDALLPILGANSVDDRGNALTLTGSFVTGSGINDLYSILSCATCVPTKNSAKPADAAAVPPVAAVPAVPYTGIDAGLATTDASGKLKTINYQSFLVGVQYYLPVSSGQVWVSVNFSQLKSSNIVELNPTNLAGVMKSSQWFDVNLFWDASKAVRFGAEYANFSQTFGDGAKAKNNRGQVSAFYIF